MSINENTFAIFKPYEIAAYCLHEMLGSWNEEENKVLDKLLGNESTEP